jgi:formylglycine-generating enzyme required for sulfatase activity/uncharacterized protein YjbI with pentapeptide repeats
MSANSQDSRPPYGKYASWASSASIFTGIAAIIGSLAAGKGHVAGTAFALVLNPVCWLAIWFWVKSTKISCPHCGMGMDITASVQTQAAGSLCRCVQCRNEFRKPALGAVSVSISSPRPMQPFAPRVTPILHDTQPHSQPEIRRGSVEVVEPRRNDREPTTPQARTGDSESMLPSVLPPEDASECFWAITPLQDQEPTTPQARTGDSESMLPSVLPPEDASECFWAMTPLQDREPDPVILRVDGSSSFTTLREHRRRGWRDIARCDLSNMNFRGESFAGVNFEGTKLDGTDFARCDFKRSIFSNVSAQNCNLEEADFSGATLSNTVFQGSNLGLVRFYSQTGDLVVASFDRVNFSDCNLSHALFTRLPANGPRLGKFCQIEQTDFSGSDMSGCDLQGCDLRTCCFLGTNLFAANLVQCNLAGVDLSTAGLINADLCKVVYSEDSTFPTGFELPIDAVVSRLPPRDDLPINSHGRELQSSLLVLAAFILVFAVIIVGLINRSQPVQLADSESEPEPRSSTKGLDREPKIERLQPVPGLPEESKAEQSRVSGEPKRTHGQESQRIENSIGMELVLIEPGTFTMGSNAGEPSERPEHTVVISQPFYLAIHEVTQHEYFEIMTANPSQFRGHPNNPVESVSWTDATRFCEKLSSLSSEATARRIYRLPTEAEWEYACRAGSKTLYSFGDSGALLHTYCWFDQNSGETQNVGLKSPNQWGLYDMHGNVWEWCFDTDDPYSFDSVIDPVSDTTGLRRVLRGGSWGHSFSECRSANRDRTDARKTTRYIGFRVAMDLVVN